LLILPLFALGAVAEQKPADAAAPSVPGTPPAVEIKIHYLTKAYDELPPLSLVDPILTDNGVQGARLAIADNNKSGAFLGQKYEPSKTSSLPTATWSPGARFWAGPAIIVPISKPGPARGR
jgi:hypothetical protein